MKVQQITTPYGPRWLLLSNSYTVIQPVYHYLKFLDVCGKSENTLRSYAYHLKLYFEFLEIKGIDVLSVFDSEHIRPLEFLSNFMLWLQYPDTAIGVYHLERETPARSDRTINTIMSTVLSFYQFLASNHEISEPEIYRFQQAGYYNHSFLSELVRQKKQQRISLLHKAVPAQNVRAITRTQYHELFCACKNRRDQLLVALLFEGGLRISEALGLHLSDLKELEAGVIHIVPRTDNLNHTRVKRYAAGIIRVPDYVVDLLLRYLTTDVLEYDSDYLFLNLYGRTKGSPMLPDTAEKLFQRLSNIVGYKVHPHMLRHGFATEKLNAGWQLVDIQVYLRHKSIASTQIYAEYSDQLKKEKMREFLSQNEDFMRKIADEIR